MGSMPLSDVVMFGAHVLLLSFISRSTSLPVSQVVTSRLDLPVIQLWVQVHSTGVVTFNTSLVHRYNRENLANGDVKGLVR